MSRIADGEGRLRDDPWKQAFKALAAIFVQLSRNARAAGMDLGPNMMGDEANDPLAVSGRQPFACVQKSILQPVDPDAAIRIEHDFDDAGIFSHAAIAVESQHFNPLSLPSTLSVSFLDRGNWRMGNGG